MSTSALAYELVTYGWSTIHLSTHNTPGLAVIIAIHKVTGGAGSKYNNGQEENDCPSLNLP